ncbi:hypothetical protein [Microseira wollei]|uniref:Uncharacterized protein n=1 Tax=Microseira wollei NIES-4236 TaxID=2530354 RepID=A0AAV3XCR4_9CYAN|nr:hypothetical protein [Microseira wollei]GET38122.1 hypothetical protein MiSe_28760 [Microseira wollei NIES-4236]
MNTQELLQQVKFIVDAEGKRSGVFLSMEVWEKLFTLVQNLENDEKVPQKLKTQEEIIPWEQFQIELAARGLPTTYNSPEDFINAIKSDFERGGLHIARQLAFRAVELYPENEQIQYYAHVLAPPKVTVVPSNPERRKMVAANQDWLRENRLKYLNRWVAVRNGDLLADAASLDELVAQIDDTKDTLITVLY